MDIDFWPEVNRYNGLIVYNRVNCPLFVCVYMLLNAHSHRGYKHYSSINGFIVLHIQQ